MENAFKEIKRWESELDGIFTDKDLEVAFKDRSRSALYRIIEKLLSEGDLIKIKRGIYVTQKAKLSSLSNRIYPDSYISTGTVLAQNTIIGSIPAKKIQAIKKGSSRIFKTDIGTIEYLSMSSKLFFGYERKENCNWATPEKAFLDTCYFYYKRKSFFFDPIEDINMQLLDFVLIDDYLKRYDKRFISYFKKTWLQE
jgi:hypothetical protein